jgi:chromosome segregation ATPase
MGIGPVWGDGSPKPRKSYSFFAKYRLFQIKKTSRQKRFEVSQNDDRKFSGERESFWVRHGWLNGATFVGLVTVAIAFYSDQSLTKAKDDYNKTLQKVQSDIDDNSLKLSENSSKHKLIRADHQNLQVNHTRLQNDVDILENFKESTDKNLIAHTYRIAEAEKILTDHTSSLNAVQKNFERHRTWLATHDTQFTTLRLERSEALLGLRRDIPSIVRREFSTLSIDFVRNARFTAAQNNAGKTLNDHVVRLESKIQDVEARLGSLERGPRRTASQ